MKGMDKSKGYSVPRELNYIKKEKEPVKGTAKMVGSNGKDLRDGKK